MQLAVCDSPAGRLGLTVCYDLRFPEMYQRLAFERGAEVLLVPSAFTRATGEVPAGFPPVKHVERNACMRPSLDCSACISRGEAPPICSLHQRGGAHLASRTADVEVHGGAHKQ